MASTPVSCDIFCRVVDNYGDAGVCWRLARQLAREHGWRVRLWIDDPAPLARLAPEGAPGIEVRHWHASAADAEPADVVVEAFACEPPAAYLEAMARRSRPPVWLNLEYLSAEPWVAGCHGLPSPHPRLPLVKHFFFPGFTAGTGGLLREADYESRRAAFDPAAFRGEFGLPPAGAEEITVSLFSYANPALRRLREAWAASPVPVRVLRPGETGPAHRDGRLTEHPLPFLPQARYDELLWSCDLNFVRGEDSFVRAQWAAQPFVWQAYPQADDAHLAKVEAFLALHPGAAGLRAFWSAWNGRGTIDWADFAAGLPCQREAAGDWAATLAARSELAKTLVQFCNARLK